MANLISVNLGLALGDDPSIPVEQMLRRLAYRLLLLGIERPEVVALHHWQGARKFRCRLAALHASHGRGWAARDSPGDFVRHAKPVLQVIQRARHQRVKPLSVLAERFLDDERETNERRHRHNRRIEAKALQLLEQHFWRDFRQVLIVIETGVFGYHLPLLLSRWTIGTFEHRVLNAARLAGARGFV